MGAGMKFPTCRTPTPAMAIGSNPLSSTRKSFCPPYHAVSYLRSVAAITPDGRAGDHAAAWSLRLGRLKRFESPQLHHAVPANRRGFPDEKNARNPGR